MSTFASEMLAAAPDLWFRLGESSGTVVTDASGNGNHGTYVNAPTLGSTGLVSGDADTSVTFAAASLQHITVPITAGMQPGTGDWAYFFLTTQQMTGVGFLLYSTAGFTQELYADGDRYISRWDGTGTQASSRRYDLLGSAVQAVWLVADRDGNLTITINDVAGDGTPLTISANSGVAANPSGTLYIARRTAGSYLTGPLDEFAYWAGTVPDAATRTSITQRALTGPLTTSAEAGLATGTFAALSQVPSVGAPAGLATITAEAFDASVGTAGSVNAEVALITAWASEADHSELDLDAPFGEMEIEALPTATMTAPPVVPSVSVNAGLATMFMRAYGPPPPPDSDEVELRMPLRGSIRFGDPETHIAFRGVIDFRLGT